MKKDHVFRAGLTKHTLNKAKRELEVFRSFADVCPLNLDLRSAHNEEPPLPDIYCEIDGQPHYFELGRVLDEDLAKRMAHTVKTGAITGGAFSQDAPLIRIVEQKAANPYPVGKESLDLLIYYDEQVPLPEALLPETRSSLFVLVQSMTLVGQWNRIWFYDHFYRRILDVHPGIVTLKDGEAEAGAGEPNKAGLKESLILEVKEEPRSEVVPIYRKRLIEAGIWRADDVRDPETDNEAADELFDWILRQLGPMATLSIFPVFGDSPSYRPLITLSYGSLGFEQIPFLTEFGDSLDTREKTICASALRVPAFLDSVRKTPETEF
jgi:hypothetical protein